MLYSRRRQGFEERTATIAQYGVQVRKRLALELLLLVSRGISFQSTFDIDFGFLRCRSFAGNYLSPRNRARALISFVKNDRDSKLNLVAPTQEDRDATMKECPCTISTCWLHTPPFTYPPSFTQFLILMLTPLCQNSCEMLSF